MINFSLRSLSWTLQSDTSGFWTVPLPCHLVFWSQVSISPSAKMRIIIWTSQSCCVNERESCIQSTQHNINTKQLLRKCWSLLSSLMLLPLILKILFLNLLHRKKFRDCHFYFSFLWLLKCVLINNIHLELHILKIFLIVWKLIIKLTWVSAICNVDFLSLHRAISNLKHPVLFHWFPALWATGWFWEQLLVLHKKQRR